MARPGLPPAQTALACRRPECRRDHPCPVGSPTSQQALQSDTRSDAGTAQARLVRNTPLLLAATAVLVLVAAAGFLFAPGRTTGAATEPLLAVQDIVASG